MKSRPFGYILVAIAIVSGAAVLVGYFFPSLAGLKGEMLDWAVIFTAVLLIVGVTSLIRSHWRKIVQNHKDRTYSLVLIFSFTLTLLVAGASGPTSTWSMWLYNNLLIPIESSLLGILAIFLLYACARLFNQRMNIYTLVFIGTVLLALLGWLVIPGVDLEVIKDASDWLSSVWAVAGVRGLLLGVALGTVATGLRILIGADRPYGG
jgi:hypothetical protein